jgi:FADH2 O2-dependent halogenase
MHDGVAVKGTDYGMGRRGGTTTVQTVVDVSGRRRTLLGNQTKRRIKDKDRVFDQCALHTGFDGYERAASASCRQLHDYILVHFLPFINSWIWQIRHLQSGGDYSYAIKQLAEDRLLLIGDVERFVDPIFSSGVSITLNSARFAHGDIIRAMDTGDFRCEAFVTSQSTITRGTRNWYHFISCYYRLMFVAFIRRSRYRLDALRLLQGDMAPPVGRTLCESVRTGGARLLMRSRLSTILR